MALPFATVDVVSDNSFYAPSAITATVAGLWSADQHFLSVSKVADGATGCSVCTHVSVPASGALSFTLGAGVYRVVVETGANFGVVGSSGEFTVKSQVAIDPPGTPVVQNATGDLVVLNGAFRSGFRTNG